MLSPGKWHELVPKDAEANARYRVAVLKRATGDLPFQKALLEACRQDILFFAWTFVLQYNPKDKEVREAGPFQPWEFQGRVFRGMLDAVEDDEDVLIEKSRQMGASWMMMILVLWFWLFYSWKKFLCISRNAEAVDCADPDSLFWKIDFMVDRLPAWMVPREWKRLTKPSPVFINRDNESAITGQASTGKAGVGGNATGMLIDEYSQIQEDTEVRHRTSNTTGSRIFNGTHLGTDTEFFRMSREPEFRKIVLHWTEHPVYRRGLYRSLARKGVPEILDTSYPFPANYKFVLDGSPTGGPFPGLRSPWYDQQCKKKGDSRAVAMDLDINPTGSVAQYFDPITIRTLQEEFACEPYWAGDIHFDPETAKPLRLVKVQGGLLKLWCLLDKEGNPPKAPYGAGCDTSEGVGATPSCFSVVNGRTGEKVVEYVTAHLRPRQFALVCVALCRLFQSEEGDGAHFAWETPGSGLDLGKKVIELGYLNIHWRTNELEAFARPPSDVPGWHSKPSSKRLLLSEYRAALAGRQFENRSHQALEECLFFKYNARGEVEHAGESSKNDPTGARVNHGDRVIADALAWKMAKESYQGVKRKEEEYVDQNSLAGRRLLRGIQRGLDRENRPCFGR